MPRNEFHIGPCRTAPEERGHGYYPYLLTQVIQANPKNSYYMIVEASSLASSRGVLKSGFRPIGRGSKNHLGQYVMDKIVES